MSAFVLNHIYLIIREAKHLFIGALIIFILSFCELFILLSRSKHWQTAACGLWHGLRAKNDVYTFKGSEKKKEWPVICVLRSLKYLLLRSYRKRFTDSCPIRSLCLFIWMLILCLNEPPSLPPSLVSHHCHLRPPSFYFPEAMVCVFSEAKYFPTFCQVLITFRMYHLTLSFPQIF